MSQKQTQSLSPQMMQSMEVLQMGSQELLEYIQDQVQENPVLEMEEKYGKGDDTAVLQRKLEWLESTDPQNRYYHQQDAEDDTDPTRLSYGNPGLEAAVYHTINLQYGHYAAKWSMTFALNTFLSNNNMSSYSFSDGDGITNTTYSNDVRSRSYGFNGSFSYRPSEKVNLSLSYNGRYSQNDFDAMDIHTDQFTFSQNLNLDFALWKEARLMLGENYSTGYAWLGGKSESYYYYYMGIKQQFLKKKLDLSIMCNNPFEKYRRNRSTSDTPTFGGWSEYRYACRSLYFRVSYRFGKQNVGVKRTAKSIRNDDMSSGAQGGGGGSTGGAQGGGGM